MSKKSDYFITFHANNTQLNKLNPGHAFTSFGEHNHQKQQSISHGSYGKYPSKSCNPVSTVLGCAGEIKPDHNRTHDHAKTVQVSQQKFNSGLTAAKAPAGTYSLFNNNCVTRQNEIAKAAGLKSGDGGIPSGNFSAVGSKNSPAASQGSNAKSSGPRR